MASGYFLEHGYAGTTMSGIAAALGGSKGTLWSYYPSKDVLFGAVLDRVTSAFREQLGMTLNADDSVEAALGKFCRKFMARITSPDAVALYRLVFGESARIPEVGRIFYERAPRRTQELLAGYLEKAMAAGSLRSEDPLCAAQQLTALCMAGSHQKLVTSVIDRVDEETMEAEAQRAVDTFLRAYRPEERAPGSSPG